MFRPFLWAAITVATACASGEFIVLHSPESVPFSGKEELNQSLLTDIFAAALGFTPKPRGDWSGIRIKNPFDLPEAVVGIAIEGVESLKLSSGMKFSLNVDEAEETTWQALSGRLEKRGKNNTLVRLRPADGLNALGQSALGELKPATINEADLNDLRLNVSEDRKFLEEIQLLRAIAKKVSSAKPADGNPDVYWLVVSGLQPLIRYHDKNTAPVNEAFDYLNKALNDISKDFERVYNDKVIIAAFTNDASKFRHARSVNLARSRREDKNPTTKVSDLKLGLKYHDSYPAVFNIFLWFGVIFFFSLLAICITIADMDPGRDSIIYRMTSNRMKKEN